VNRSAKSCLRWRRKLALFAAEGLEPPVAARVEAHLRSCPNCREALADYRALNDRLCVLGAQLPSVDPSPDLRRRWQAVLHQTDPAWTKSSERPWGEIIAWLPGGAKSWPALASCWVFIVVLRVLSPSVAAPAASTPYPPLDQVISLLLTGDSDPRPSPEQAGVEGACGATILEVVAGTPGVTARHRHPSWAPALRSSSVLLRQADGEDS
jgi:hypothetical protein